MAEFEHAAMTFDFGLEDVLSLEEMVADRRARRDPEWAAHVETLAGYASGLFEALR